MSKANFSEIGEDENPSAEKWRLYFAYSSGADCRIPVGTIEISVEGNPLLAHVKSNVMIAIALLPACKTGGNASVVRDDATPAHDSVVRDDVTPAKARFDWQGEVPLVERWALPLTAKLRSDDSRGPYFVDGRMVAERPDNVDLYCGLSTASYSRPAPQPQNVKLTTPGRVEATGWVHLRSSSTKATASLTWFSGYWLNLVCVKKVSGNDPGVRVTFDEIRKTVGNSIDFEEMTYDQIDKTDQPSVTRSAALPFRAKTNSTIYMKFEAFLKIYVEFTPWSLERYGDLVISKLAEVVASGDDQITQVDIVSPEDRPWSATMRFTHAGASDCSVLTVGGPHLGGHAVIDQNTIKTVREPCP